MKTVIAFTLLVAAYAAAGNGDYELEQKFVAKYCNNVQLGVWKPYKPSITCQGE